MFFNISDDVPIPSEWTHFGIATNGDADFVFRFISRKASDLDFQDNLYFFDSVPRLLIERSNMDYIESNEEWNHFSIYVADFSAYQINRLFFIAVRTALIYRQSLFFHGALIDWSGAGILFIGPSGIGKSTQADLWSRKQNADIINGDVALVRRKDDLFFGYGSPWHGNSEHCKNKSVPLRAIVVLEQSNSNRLDRLKGSERIYQTLNNVHLPRWLPDCYLLVLDVLDDLLSKVPVYLLRNKADDAAVQLLLNEMLKINPESGNEELMM